MAVQLCVLPWIFSSLCCHVVFGTGRWRRAVLASERERERMASFFVYCPSMWCHLFPGRADCVWKLLCCSLWLCYGRHIPRARRRGRKDHTPDSRPHHQCVVSKVVTPQGSADEMCCTGKEVVVVDAYQSIKISLWWICEVSVRVALGVFLSLKLKWWLLSTTKNKMDSHVRWWR